MSSHIAKSFLIAQPALDSIGDAARWRDSFGCAALADTDGDDYDMRIVILMKVALRKRRMAAADGGGDGDYCYINRPPHSQSREVQKKHFAHP